MLDVWSSNQVVGGESVLTHEPAETASVTDEVRSGR